MFWFLNFDLGCTPVLTTRLSVLYLLWTQLTNFVGLLYLGLCSRSEIFATSYGDADRLLSIGLYLCASHFADLDFYRFS